MRVPADPAVGQRIMRRRQALNMSQGELARLIDVSRDTVSNWETGKHFPKRYLGKIEAVLGIDLHSRDDGFRPVSPQLRKMVLETLEDPDDQRRVLGLLEGTLTWPERSEGEAQRLRPAAG